MLRIKRLYTFMLQTFLPLFFMTFGICLFIVLMQFLWKYIDDMVGKGIDIAVLAEMFMYAALSLVPMALPLAVLLASLMTFGNLGERLELLAMKSAGISLIHIMRPLIITLVLVSIGTFFYQNNAMPVVQVKLYTLLYSMRQKSPELEIPEGSFYKDIPGLNVYVQRKDTKTGLLSDLMIYDYSEGFNNARVIVADSGRLKTSADKLFLVLSLYNGESFENLRNQDNGRQDQTAVPYRRESFETKEILIEFDANFKRTDDSFLQNQYMGKNLQDLQASIDSMGTKLDSIKTLNARSIYEGSYLRTVRAFGEQEVQPALRDTAPGKRELVVAVRPMPNLAGTLRLDFDSAFVAMSKSSQATTLKRAKNSLENMKTDYFFRAASVGDEAYKVRRHLTEWHKKFTVAYACLMFFFIGAPLGAIIRKGGLGVPVVISVILFIFYYIIDNMGFKMARDGVWSAWEGMWLSSVVLTPMGAFLTYKAAKDSVIMNADTYLNALKNLLGKREGRKIEKKEVIIYVPDYDAMLPVLQRLEGDCGMYVRGHRRWVNYLKYWREGGKDNQAEQLAGRVEAVVEELGNSDQILLLNKLMDFPIVGGYVNPLGERLTPQAARVVGWCLPLGLPLYLIAVYQRKLLRHDISQAQKTAKELIDMIYSLHLLRNKNTDNK